MARKRRRSIFFWLILFPALLVGGFALACNVWIVSSTSERIYESANQLVSSPIADGDEKPVGLVLGTSKNVAPNTPNAHFDNRITAAASLINEGIVDQLLVSGYRDSQYYDETVDMIARLREAGISESVIVADNEGARTLDSMSRAKSEFGFDRVIVVSDDFHVARALFIADRVGLDAVAMQSKSVEIEKSGRVRLREYFARVKAVLDLFVLEPPNT